jgi:hypothetical protein
MFWYTRRLLYAIAGLLAFGSLVAGIVLWLIL